MSKNAVDWRGLVKANQRKTLYALLSFLFVYLMLGAITVIFFSPHVPMEHWPQLLLLSDSLQILSVFFLVAMLTVMLGMFFGGRLVLSGSEAILVGEDHEDPRYQKLFHIVEEMKVAASLRYMPKVYVLPVTYMNAFAAGWHEKNAVVAVTEPMLDIMTRDELQAVIAHELTHIRNQDTRVMTMVSVMAGLSVLIIDVMFRSVLYSSVGRSRGKSKGSGGAIIIIVMILRFILPIITSFLVMYVSRKRELLADAGGVELTRSHQSLANALIKIHKHHRANIDQVTASYKNTPNEQMRNTAYIYSPSMCGIRNKLDASSLFSTHPSLQERLEALGVTDSESIQ